MAGDYRKQLAAKRAIGWGRWPWLLGALLLLLSPSQGDGKGLVVDRPNQVTICMSSAVASPTFTLLFTAQPLSQLFPGRSGGLNAEQLGQLRRQKTSLVLTVGGKGPGRERACYDYFFGPGEDGDRPWNNGQDFAWQRWAEMSDELWDHIAVAREPGPAGDGGPITAVAVRRGGELLFDSRQRDSVPNHLPMSVSLTEEGESRLVELGMMAFRRSYYELGELGKLGESSPLEVAYGDLAQTDASKYRQGAGSWCSEFAAYVYRAGGIKGPDPLRGELNWRGLKAYFGGRGALYSLWEVASWPAAEREARIKPGALISMVTAKGEAHTLLLSQWKHGDAAAVFTAISGNSHGMVRHQRALSLAELVAVPSKKAMSTTETLRYQARSFIVIPPELGGR